MTDFLLVAWVSMLIELTRLQWMLGGGRKWSPGEKLKLLFAGYNGTRNTGSDVRVNEMIRQIRHVLGTQQVDFSVMTQSFDRTKGYFEGTRQVFLPDVFPPFLYREARQNHGVVACEGSMFKSKFANALTTMMIGSLGHASAENKLSIGYGAEAGHMDSLIEKMCARYVHDSLVITRNVESQSVLGKLGISTELGTDTAWTFEPHPDSYGRQTLRDAGWDEKTPVLVLCPIHPFVWPVKASIAKYIARITTGAYKEAQYRTVYFHESGSEVDRKFKHYINGFGKAAAALGADPAVRSLRGRLCVCPRLPDSCRIPRRPSAPCSSDHRHSHRAVAGGRISAGAADQPSVLGRDRRPRHRQAGPPPAQGQSRAGRLSLGRRQDRRDRVWPVDRRHLGNVGCDRHRPRHCLAQHHPRHLHWAGGQLRPLLPHR